MNEIEPSNATAPRSVDQQQACYALVRRCDICGKVNAIDLEGTAENEQALQMEDHAVMRMSKAEALEVWKGAGRCDHKAIIADLRAQLAAHNDKDQTREPKTSI